IFCFLFSVLCFLFPIPSSLEPRMPRRRPRCLGQFLTLMVLCSPALAQAASARSYEIRAAIDPFKRRIEGRVRIRFTNTGPRPLPHVSLWLSPNRFRSPPPLNDVEYYWVYPLRFDPGSMELVELRVGGRGLDLRTLAAPPGPWGEQGLLRIPLPEPLQPGQ